MMEKEDVEIESSCTKTNLLIENLVELFARVALMQTESDYQNGIVTNCCFSFRCKKTKELFSCEVAFKDLKIVYLDNLSDEMQPADLENERYIFQDKTKTFTVSGCFDLLIFRFEKRLLKSKKIG